MKHGFTIVDVHTHTYMPEKSETVLNAFALKHRLEPTCMATGRSEELLELMDGCGIDFSVMANIGPLKILHKNNLWTLALAAKNKRLIPLIGVHPEMEGGIVANLEKYLAAGAKGVKMHNIVQEYMAEDVRLIPFWEFCDANCVPVMFHCGSLSRVYMKGVADIEHYLPLFDSYPNIPFNVTHMADGKVDDLLFLKERFGNLFFDTSMTISGKHCIHRIHSDFWENDKNVVDIVREIGSGRVMFGSDYPFGRACEDLERFLGMGFTQEELIQIMGQNALRFLGLSNR